MCRSRIDLFTVVCLVTWSLNESETRGDLVSNDRNLTAFVMVKLRTCSITNIRKAGRFYQSKLTSSLTIIQRPGNEAHNCKNGQSQTLCDLVITWTLKNRFFMAICLCLLFHFQNGNSDVLPANGKVGSGPILLDTKNEVLPRSSCCY